jgi:tRNA G18 (ribose-2'-O)-methylase SpoU
MTQMGRIGGIIGGKRRAARMTPEARRASASLAAKARWAGKASPESMKLKQEAGLRRIAQILEQHMTDMGFNEEEKNEKTALLMSLVGETVTAKLKAPAKRKEHLQISASQA